MDYPHHRDTHSGLSRYGYLFTTSLTLSLAKDAPFSSYPQSIVEASSTTAATVTRLFRHVRIIIAPQYNPYPTPYNPHSVRRPPSHPRPTQPPILSSSAPKTVEKDDQKIGRSLARRRSSSTELLKGMSQGGTAQKPVVAPKDGTNADPAQKPATAPKDGTDADPAHNPGKNGGSSVEIPYDYETYGPAYWCD